MKKVLTVLLCVIALGGLLISQNQTTFSEAVYIGGFPLQNNPEFRIYGWATSAYHYGKMWVDSTGNFNITGPSGKLLNINTAPTYTTLTASKVVFTDSSKALTSTGTVAVNQGGTGAATLALNGILYGNGTSAVGVTAIGAEGQLLRVGASPFVPAWTTATFPATAGSAGNVLVSDGTNWSSANVLSAVPTGLTYTTATRALSLTSGYVILANADDMTNGISIAGASDTFNLTHDGTDAYLKTSDGMFIFQTDEGTNTDTEVALKPKGTSEIARVLLYDTDSLEAEYYVGANAAYLLGTTALNLYGSRASGGDLNFYSTVHATKGTINFNNVVRYAGTPQTLTGAGAVDVVTSTTWVVTGAADALTLADGEEGQIKFIIMKTDGGDGTLTPTNKFGFSTITFNDVGDSVQLLFTNGAWYVVGYLGVTIA